MKKITKTIVFVVILTMGTLTTLAALYTAGWALVQWFDWIIKTIV